MFDPIVVITDMLGGINSKQRATKIKDNQSVELVGFDLDANSFRRAKGYTKFGTESNVDLTGKTIYTHVVSGTHELIVKSIGTFLKYYDSVSGNYYKLTTSTFTAGLRWCFQSFNGFLYGVNGTDNWVFWDGSARSTLAASITPASITVSLATGTGVLFNVAGGSIMIEDDKISYTSVSGDTLTGVTGIDSNHAAGVTIITELDSSTYSGVEKAIRIEIYKNRMYMISAINRCKIMFSVLADSTDPQTDLLDFTVAGGSGDAGFDFNTTELITLKTFVNGPNNSILVVFDKAGRKYQFVVTDSTDTTTDSFVHAQMSDNYPVQPHLVIQAENQLIYVDQYGHIQGLQYGNINSPLVQQDLSFYIHPSVEVTDFDDGYIGFSNKKLYVGGATTDRGIDDIVYYYDSNYNAWGAYTHWDAIDFTIYGGEPYALSAVTGNTFKLNDGLSVYIDDADNANQGDYVSEWVSKEWDFKRPLFYKQTVKARARGIITSNCPVYLDIYTDGTKLFTFLIDGSNQNIQVNVPNVAVGTIVFGQGVFGGGLPHGTVRKEWQAHFAFSVIGKPFLRIQIRIRISSHNVDFELIDGMLWAKEMSSEYWLDNQILTQV